MDRWDELPDNDAITRTLVAHPTPWYTDGIDIRGADDMQVDVKRWPQFIVDLVNAYATYRAQAEQPSTTAQERAALIAPHYANNMAVEDWDEATRILHQDVAEAIQAVIDAQAAQVRSLVEALTDTISQLNALDPWGCDPRQPGGGRLAKARTALTPFEQGVDDAK